jgi:hypothetical protein
MQTQTKDAVELYSLLVDETYGELTSVCLPPPSTRFKEMFFCKIFAPLDGAE